MNVKLPTRMVWDTIDFDWPTLRAMASGDVAEWLAAKLERHLKSVTSIYIVQSCAGKTPSDHEIATAELFEIGTLEAVTPSAAKRGEQALWIVPNKPGAIHMTHSSTDSMRVAHIAYSS